ncbi:MAG TPA: hypothetical protein HA232_04420 [Methanocellales archaeon]|nr:hypothetical protein [Methanocellales archaeon]
MKLTILISVFGLVINLMGSFFLVKSFIRKQPEAMVREVTLYPGRNISRLKDMLYQKVEAIAGSLLLLFGFGVQMFGYLIQSDLTLPSYVVALVFLIGLTLLLYVVNLLIAKVLTWYSRKMIKPICLEDMKNSQYNEKSLIGCGEYLDIPRKKSESDTDYAKRVSSFITP